MSWVNAKNRHALCSGDTEVIYAEVNGGRKGLPRVATLARLAREMNKPFDGAALVAGTGKKKFQLALVLPLREFTTVSVTVPPVSREAVAKMLPYSLAKALDRPVSDFIYDWQVAQMFKDRHELTVYLFPSSIFESYRRELRARGREIVWFEPDVFAACGFLESAGFINPQSTLLCVLAWGTSVSIAVFGERRVCLVRTVDLIQPSGRPGEIVGGSGQAESGAAGGETAVDQENGEVAASGEKIGRSGMEAEDASFSDLLAGFGLQDETVFEQRLANAEGARLETSPEPAPSAAPASEADRWQEYIDALNLEIMRTADYHTSVLKGAPLQGIFLGGCETFFPELSALINIGHAIPVHRFPPAGIEADCGQLLAALCIGATQR